MDCQWCERWPARVVVAIGDDKFGTARICIPCIREIIRVKLAAIKSRPVKPTPRSIHVCGPIPIQPPDWEGR